MQNEKNAWLGIAATLLVLATAILLDDRSVASAPGWATVVEAGGDHIDPEELAQRLLAGGEDVLVIDLRPAEDFETGFRLPGSLRFDLPELLGPRGLEVLEAARDKTIVLTASGMTHAGQAWVELERRGFGRARVLEDGIDGFRRRVLLPPSLRTPTTPERAEAARAEWRRARDYFLQGEPQDAKPAAPPIERFAKDPDTLTAPTVVSTAWTARRGAEVVVVDARDKAADFEAKHLPGAVHAPIGMLRGLRDGIADELLPAEELARKMGELGIGSDSEVVVYAGGKLQDATHFILALASLGHRRMAVMEGGLEAWQAEGRPVATGPVSPEARDYGKPADSLVTRVGRATVDEARRTGQALILDVRPTDAFRGEVLAGEARAGHIPGSASRPFSQDVVSGEKGLYWRRRADLEAAYTQLAADPARRIIVSCRTGHQASQTWFTLEVLLGRRNVEWYDGSWKDWAAHPELPVETGDGAR